MPWKLRALETQSPETPALGTHDPEPPASIASRTCVSGSGWSSRMARIALIVNRLSFLRAIHSGIRYLMSIRHSLIRFATPRIREKFTCTFVGTGRNVRYVFFIYCRYCSTGGTFPKTIAGGNYSWEHMDYHMNLEERVVATEVASRRADGPGVIEVQSQLSCGEST